MALVSPSPGVELVFGIHTCPDRPLPMLGMSQKFLVASLTVRDAVSPGRSCTRTSPATSRKCPAPLPGLEAGVSQHGNKIYCLSFLNNALAHFKHLLKMDLGQEVLGMRYAECCMSCRVFAA